MQKEKLANPISVRFKPSHDQALEALASKQEVSKGYLVRQAVAMFLASCNG